ncbi:IclR family transcriptional regulator [Natrialba sp. PRR66]|uniref:IclR family transcriptional regulator n=1 Tax=Natrialba sp. PRR66 TaxID=3098146 RepID=UPI002B1E723B|nr:IclR family transcriptional regulator [Natrialba sp. PRR66]
MATYSDPGTVKATRTTFEIIETLAEADGGQVTEIANKLGLAKSTVHRHLATLEDLEYVVKDGDMYRIGFRFLKLGEETRKCTDTYQMASQKVKKIAEQTSERAQFVVEEHGKAVYVFGETGEHAVQTNSTIGKSRPLQSMAAGKAILAHLPEERVTEIIRENGLPAMTENTITDEDELYEELAEIRERGYSINNQETIPGLRAIGVSIECPDSGVFGALSVSGPTHRVQGDRLEETIPSILLGTANELELDMKYS